MKILVCPGVYLPLQRAGSEIYLHKVLKWLKKHHEIIVLSHCPNGDYQFEGIEVRKCDPVNFKTDNVHLWEWADLIFTQLSGTPYVMNKMRIHNKKVINFAHNNGAYAQIPIRKNVYSVYNCHNTAKELNYGHESFVLPPPIWKEDYAGVDRTGAEYITLINHNENKGGNILIEIAKRMPEYKFMAVRGGYYEQIYSKEPNITYVPLVDDIRPYLAKTRILIAPSEYESYGQAQVEAMCCGIPVIATDLPGFREAMGIGLISIKNRLDIELWVKEIMNFIEYTSSRLTYHYSLMRASELTPEKDLQNLNNWLEKINNLAIK